MPIIAGLTGTQQRAVNAVMARAFFPRAKKNIYTELAGSVTSTSAVEPFSILGSVPPLSQYTGRLSASLLADYSMSVPNLLFKNYLKINQESFEFDQTGTIMDIAPAMGIRLAEHPDQLFCSRVLKGGDPDAVSVRFRGQNYSTTMDGLPYFSTAHPTAKSGNQSNIVQGTLPATSAAVAAQSFATSASQMIQDMTLALDRIATVKDHHGIPIYANLDPREHVVVVVPPALRPIATLAFRSADDAVINQTTNIMPAFVKKVISASYLAGFPDPDTGETILPVNQTDWYIFIVDDFVKPFYMQLFRPLNKNELRPTDEAIPDPISEIMKADKSITVEQATLFASARIDTTFRRIGADADLATIESEAFGISARYRGNCVYGPWFTGLKVIPASGGLYHGELGSSSSSSSASSATSATSNSSSSSSSS